MKNLLLSLAAVASSLFLFSCTADELDEDTTETVIIDDFQVGGEGDVFDDEDTH